MLPRTILKKLYRRFAPVISYLHCSFSKQPRGVGSVNILKSQSSGAAKCILCRCNALILHGNNRARTPASKEPHIVFGFSLGYKFISLVPRSNAMTSSPRLNNDLLSTNTIVNFFDTLGCLLKATDHFWGHTLDNTLLDTLLKKPTT